MPSMYVPNGFSHIQHHQRSSELDTQTSGTTQEVIHRGSDSWSLRDVFEAILGSAVAREYECDQKGHVERPHAHQNPEVAPKEVGGQDLPVPVCVCVCVYMCACVRCLTQAHTHTWS
jgi:hypothetical protein